MRARAKRTVERLGLMPQARRLQRVFGSSSTKRDLRDNDHLKLLLAETRPADIFRLLCEDAKLRIFDLDGGGPYGRREFEGTFERASHWNFVAHR
jgi:hypothetical protein